MSKGFLVILSSPSGGGKTTLRKEILHKNPSLYYSVSCTTRPPREGEEEGKDYIFLPEEEFRKKIEQGEFLEWATVHGYLYGTLKETVEEKLREGKIVLLDIDVQGARKLRKIFPESVYIFILPPSWEELERRLKRRRTESPPKIKERLKIAQWEIRFYTDYDYLIINDKVEKAVEEILCIIEAEKRKMRRNEKVIEKWLKK